MSLDDINAQLGRLNSLSTRHRKLISDLQDGLMGAMQQIGSAQTWMPPYAAGGTLAREFDFKNNNAGTVPAYGIIRITGHDGTQVTADQPNDYSSQFLHALNTGSAVASGAIGRAIMPMGFPSLCKYNTANTPAFGETWGPVASSWELTKLSGGFAVVGNPTGGNVTVVQAPMLMALGQIDGTGMTSDGSTGTMSVFYWNAGTWTDTTFNLTVRVSSAAPIEGGRKVEAKWDGVTKQWVAKPMEPHGSHVGQFDADVLLDATGTFSIGYWNGATWTDTTNNVTARNTTKTTIKGHTTFGHATAQRATIQWDGRSAQWVSGPVSCP